MTVQKDVTKNIYVGNGSTRTFPFTFECPAEHPEYIKVYLMQDDGTALATSDYQLDMDARQITYPSSGTALPEGKKLVIMRELPLQQMMNLVNNGPYFAEDVELAFDENVMAMQQIAEKLNRSIIMSVDIDGDAFVNEVPFEAGKSFRIADDGKSIVLTEDPGKVIDEAKGLLKQTTEQAEFAKEQADASSQSAVNAQNAADAAEAVAPEYAKTKEVLDNIVSYTNTATEQARIATAKANAANVSAANAAQSYTNADAVATQLTEYLATKESLTAPAVDKTLLIEGAAADSKVVGKIKNDTKRVLNAISKVVSTKTGYVISFDDCDTTNIFDISDTGYCITGSNLLDYSSRVYKKILNDSGVEVDDANSSYFSRMIPVEPNQRIYTNFSFQRVYLYNNNGDFIGRTGLEMLFNYQIPNGVYFIQIQYSHTEIISDKLMANFGTAVLPYEAYKENTSGKVYNGVNNIGSVGKAIIRTANLKKLIDGVDNIITNNENTIPTSKAVLEKITSMSGDTIEIADSGNILYYGKEITNRIVNVSVSSGAKFVGSNVFDQSTRVYGKIINDSGVEVDDSQSNYFSQYIPVHGMTLKANFKIQRMYLYDINKTLIRRIYIYNDIEKIMSFGSEIYFVRVQAKVLNITDSMCIVYGDNDASYSKYHISETDFNPYESISIYSDGVSNVDVTVKVSGVKAYIQSVKAYPMWEPENVTNDYSCTPLGQTKQSIPLLTDTLKYQGFLDEYYNVYLGVKSDGYSVTRKELGLDSGAEAPEHYASPVFSYEFKPKYYNKTVLLSAGMNTCEASTYFGLAYFIKSLMEHTEDGMLALYNTTRFIVIPVICPSGIAHNPLLYPNSNNVRINKNFEYYGSWERLKSDMGGAYPDSEVETKILKKWINDYAGSAFWLDCHSDTAATTPYLHLGSIFCSDSNTAAMFELNKQLIIDFYKNKGYYTTSDNPTLGFFAQTKETSIYPKTVYAKEVAMIPSAMMEQFMYSTAWGSDGNTNNDSYSIKHYVAMIRYMVLEICKDTAKFIY